MASCQPHQDLRIIAADNHHVTFLAREGVRVGGEREQVSATIPTIEFVRRWCLHIQPDQLTKTRYFGGWCCHKRKKYQAACRHLLSLDPNVQTDEETELLSSLDGEPDEQECQFQCAACGCRKLGLISQTPKPSWAQLLDYKDDRCPAWYAEADHLEFCRFLEREYGISYSDWCLEMQQESTMEPPEPPAQGQPARQLYLPGLFPDNGYLVASY